MALISIVTPVLARMIVGDETDFRQRLERRVVIVREIGSGVERRPAPDVAVLSEDGARTLLHENAERVLADREPQERRALTDLGEAFVRPTAELNLRATEERKQQAEAGVKEVTISLRKGEIIVRDGSPIA